MHYTTCYVWHDMMHDMTCIMTQVCDIDNHSTYALLSIIVIVIVYLFVIHA
jgi:hypothetical protein